MIDDQAEPAPKGSRPSRMNKLLQSEMDVGENFLRDIFRVLGRNPLVSQPSFNKRSINFDQTPPRFLIRPRTKSFQQTDVCGIHARSTDPGALRKIIT